jgi:RNA polymerase sigma-70 factor, ECF subfamily
MTNQPPSPKGMPDLPPDSATVQDVRRLVSGWVDSYHAEIFRFLVRLSKDATVAEDLVQEAFLKAFRSCQQLRGQESVRPWLYRIAWNTYLSYRRSSQSSPAAEAEDAVQLQDERPDAEHLLLTQELRGRLREIVDGLPLQQRSAFILRAGHQLSYEEVAACLECSPSAARSHFRHALRKMKAVCQKEGLH